MACRLRARKFPISETFGVSRDLVASHWSSHHLMPQTGEASVRDTGAGVLLVVHIGFLGLLALPRKGYFRSQRH
ncbi:hypothetical protein KIN20_028236 [Parelaphostrongylus tenuis]|uniref:Uncharacterized protein n=1 Tax=Parelaphostrongylus tenuis TaxID=148309 RepID=A0AAD5WEL4_PARTN|nr:hypothetical protein KIN20_028236 [Parelaphostrongylus tenuis]